MKTRSVVLAALVALVLSGCETSNVESAAETPPPEVEVVKATAVSVQPWKTFTTRIEAPERVDLRPRISGVIESVHFVEGQQVEKGQLLFSLDQRHLIAQVEQLKSELVRADAAFDQARQEAQRARRLVARQAIAEEQAELRESVERQTQAEVAAIKARLAAAELDLSYASIRAPIAGTIARANITAGNTVTANQSLLTNISSNQSRYAYFDMDERTWHQHFSTRDQALGVPVLLQLTGETGFPHRGQIDFVDNAIDTGTGTLRLRAVLSGGDDAPVPGAFARVRLAVAKASQKILVPDRAIATDLDSRFVLTVADDGKTEYTPVTLGDRFGAYRVITSGLAADTWVVANGTAKIGPDTPISAVEIPMDTSNLQLTLSASGDTAPRTAAVAKDEHES